MAVAGGWLVDKSAAARAAEPEGRAQLEELVGLLHLCPIGELEQLYSARSARDYDALKEDIHRGSRSSPRPGTSSTVRSTCRWTWRTTTACGTAPRYLICSSPRRRSTTASGCSTSIGTTNGSQRSDRCEYDACADGG